MRIILREDITWSNIWIGLSGIDAAAVLSNCYLGVYSSAVAKPLALVTPFSAPAGTYFIAMLLGGT
ncbi:hypothetical protein [Streptomyces sp. NBC_00211]|uniref:hypothetical protein n=1 Tax=Streptomyces sp. NBC_00211 TaxID=2975683 RepID=UPI0032554D71